MQSQLLTSRILEQYISDRQFGGCHVLGPDRLFSLTTLMVVVAALVFLWHRGTSVASAPTDVQIPIIPDSTPDKQSIVGPEGGEVVTPDGRVRAVIPTGAFAQPTYVLLGVSIPRNAGSNVAFQTDLALAAVDDHSTVPVSAEPIIVRLTPSADDLVRMGQHALSLTVKEPNVSDGSVTPLENQSVIPSAFEVSATSATRFTLSSDVQPVDQTASSIVTPLAGGALVSTDGLVTVAFPPQGASEPLRIEQRPIEHIGDAAFHIVRQFELNAFATARGDAPITAFAQPVELTVHHTTEEMAGWQYDALRLYWWNEETSAWEMIPDQGVSSVTCPKHWSNHNHSPAASIRLV